MAERGAHLTATEQEKPSIFEVVAADSLHATFYPAIKRLCMVLANAHPDKFGWAIRHYDELFLALNAAVQQYYVRQFGGSLSEIFYGLTRQRIRAPHQLSATARWLLFGSVVLLPYARIKLDALVQCYREDDERLDPTTTARQRALKRLAVRLYTGCIGVYECLQVLQYIAYMANQSAAHSLAVRLLGQQLAYADDESADDWSWSDLLSGQLRPATFLTAAVFRGLELSAFFLQFVRWWQDEASAGSLMRLPVPAAPPDDSNSAKYMGICPLCVQSWEIPTAVAISGYVYCYKCIVKHMAETRRTCPVSQYPADVDDLIRVFEV